MCDGRRRVLLGTESVASLFAATAALSSLQLRCRPRPPSSRHRPHVTHEETGAETYPRPRFHWARATRHSGAGEGRRPVREASRGSAAGCSARLQRSALERAFRWERAARAEAGRRTGFWERSEVPGAEGVMWGVRKVRKES